MVSWPFPSSPHVMAGHSKSLDMPASMLGRTAERQRRSFETLETDAPDPEWLVRDDGMAWRSKSILARGFVWFRTLKSASM